MSSLRVETLRLCWLEAFIAVADEENISAAANVLDIDQSTVSRYMQALEKWVGKKLIEPGKISDPENPRVSVGLTDDGRLFYDIAQQNVQALHEFRSTGAARSEAIGRFSGMVSRLELDQVRDRRLSVVRDIEENVEDFRSLLNMFSDEAPVEDLRNLNRELRDFFTQYEKKYNKQRRKRRKPAPPPEIPDDWFDQQKEAPVKISPSSIVL